MVAIITEPNPPCPLFLRLFIQLCELLFYLGRGKIVCAGRMYPPVYFSPLSFFLRLIIQLCEMLFF
jgi:hypothetical protein